MPSMACRQHVLEIMLEVVVNSLEVSTVPDLLMFKRFQSSWSSVNQVSFKTIGSDVLILEKIIKSKPDIIEFSKN